MRNKSNVRKRLSILSNAIEDTYGKRLSSFYSEARDIGEICFMPHPLLAITITVDKHSASVMVKESESITKPGTIKSIRDFNHSSILDICEFVETNVNEAAVRFGGSDYIKPMTKPDNCGWFVSWMYRLGFIDWWEGTK